MSDALAYAVPSGKRVYVIWDIVSTSITLERRYSNAVSSVGMSATSMGAASV